MHAVGYFPKLDGVPSAHDELRDEVLELEPRRTRGHPPGSAAGLPPIRGRGPRYPLAATWFRMASQLWTFCRTPARQPLGVNLGGRGDDACDQEGYRRDPRRSFANTIPSPRTLPSSGSSGVRAHGARHERGGACCDGDGSGGVEVGADAVGLVQLGRLLFGGIRVSPRMCCRLSLGGYVTGVGGLLAAARGLRGGVRGRRSLAAPQPMGRCRYPGARPVLRSDTQ